MNRLEDLANAVAEALERAIELDIAIATDRLAYANWCLGVAAAGFALVIGRGDWLVTGALFSQPIAWRLLHATSLLFLLSLGAGSTASFLNFTERRDCRVLAALLRRQKASLLEDGTINQIAASMRVDEVFREKIGLSLIDRRYLWLEQAFLRGQLLANVHVSSFQRAYRGVRRTRLQTGLMITQVLFLLLAYLLLLVLGLRTEAVNL